MSIVKSFDATPNTNIIDVLGHSGYTLGTAVADIVDNSITAGAKHIQLNLIYDGENSSIEIIDDGCGMSLDKMVEACIVAYKDMNDARDLLDLGRFSTGLDSASMSMAKVLIVQSKINEVNTLKLDFSKMKKVGWKIDQIDDEVDHIKTNTGTAIIWRNLRELASANSRKDFFEKVASVGTHLDHVFNDYIQDGLEIRVNNFKLKGWDPFYKNNAKTSVIIDTVQRYLSSEIKIKAYILPPYNNLNANDQAKMRGYGLSEQQGFYIYRNNRLIKEGGWLGLEDFSISNKYDYARIRVDIDNKLDEAFNPNFMKSEINIPDDIQDFFKKIAKKARMESRKNYNYMKAPSILRETKHNNKVPVWNVKNSRDGILLGVNENHPIIKSICSKLTESEKKRLFKLLAQNIPVGEIHRSGVSNTQNNYVNLKEDIEELYNQFVEDGMDKKEIMSKMFTCEPFCSNDDSLTELIEFFESRGLLNDQQK